jgi:hypothetical protein
MRARAQRHATFQNTTGAETARERSTRLARRLTAALIRPSSGSSDQRSRDGRLLVFQSVDGNNNIASVATVDGSAPIRLIGRGVDVDGPMFLVMAST